MTPHERRLFDELEIQKLAAAYSHGVMRLDARAAAAVYMEDGVLSAFYAADIAGRAAIGDALVQALKPLEFLIQTCSAGVIDVSGDTARATWSVTELLKYREQDNLACCFGVYEDQLVRSSEGWRFSHRRFLPHYKGSIPSTGKSYRPAEFGQDYSPWPFLGTPVE